MKWGSCGLGGWKCHHATILGGVVMYGASKDPGLKRAFSQTKSQEENKYLLFPLSTYFHLSAVSTTLYISMLAVYCQAKVETEVE